MPRSSVAPTRRAIVLRILAPAALLLGYADLARGGTVAAPVLLVCGYLALVPALILEPS